MKTFALVLPLLFVVGCGASDDKAPIETKEEFVDFMYQQIEPKLGDFKRPEARNSLAAVMKAQDLAPSNLSQEDVDWAYEELDRRVREYEKPAGD